MPFHIINGPDAQNLMDLLRLLIFIVVMGKGENKLARYSVEGMRTHTIENMSIDDKIEYWHTHETGNSLREFLGMTEQEYFDFCIEGTKTKTKK